MNDRQRRAMFAKMGKGAIVKVKKPFGINDVPVGTKGVVLSHKFGRGNPEVKFEGVNGTFVPNSDVLELVQGSSKYIPKSTEEILIPKSKSDLIKTIKENHSEYSSESVGVSDDGVINGELYLDNGEGRQGYASYSGKVYDGKIEVKMNKNDIPSYWRWMYDDLFGEAVERVEHAIGLQ